MDKKKLREKYLKVRENIINKELKSLIIASKVIDSELYKNANVVALYKSFSNEVDTFKLIDYTNNCNKTIALPRVEGKDLIFYKYKPYHDNLVRSKFGVLEPLDIKNNIISDIDLVIVPGVVFDYSGNRIGYGGGYYDRYLSNKNINTIGVCFDSQLTDNILVEEHDVSLDQIITEDKVLKIKK